MAWTLELMTWSVRLIALIVAVGIGLFFYFGLAVFIVTNPIENMVIGYGMGVGTYANLMNYWHEFLLFVARGGRSPELHPFQEFALYD